MNVSTTAIILRTINYLESSKIVYAYTREFGKQTFVAKGARRTKSKFGSSLEICSIVDLKYYKKTNRDMYNLTNSELLRNNYLDKLNFNDKILFFMMCESIFKIEKDDISDENYFDLLERLVYNCSLENLFSINMFIYSQLELANSIGHSINLKWDNSKIVDYSENKDLYLDISNCKIYADNKTQTEKKMKFKIEELNLLKNISNGNLDSNINNSQFRKIVYFFENYFSYHTENKFRYNSFELFNL